MVIIILQNTQKKLGSGLNPKGCLYFEGFQDAKLLNGFLVV